MEAQAKEIWHNTYQLTGGEDHCDLNGSSYAFTNGDHTEAVVFDIGDIETISLTLAKLSSIGIKESQIRALILSHPHRDHASGAAALFDVPTYIHDADLKAVRTGDWGLTAAFMYGITSPPVAHARSLGELGYEFRFGQFDFEVIPTPGHTKGSVCLRAYDRQNDSSALHAGDTLWGGCHPQIGSDMDAWSDSLDLLMRLKIDRVSFGHGIARYIQQGHAHVRLARSLFTGRIQMDAGRDYFNPWDTIHPKCITTGREHPATAS